MFTRHMRIRNQQGPVEIARPWMGWIVCASLVCVCAVDSGAQVRITHKVSASQGNLTRLLEAGDEFGGAVANIGDLDGNGVEDVAVGAAMDDYPGINHGTVWILLLNPNGTVKARQKIGSDAGGFTGVLDQDDYFGSSVASIGDLNGDGTPDLVVGATRDDDGGTDRGAVWVLFMNNDGTVKGARKISSTQGAFGGSLDDGDHFGASVAYLGDVDGDGHPDIGVGADRDDDGGADEGAVWVLFLSPDGTVKGHQKISALEGGFGGTLDAEDFFGSSIGLVGDLGEGAQSHLAIVVGAPGDDDGATDAGAVWVLFLSDDGTGTVVAHQKISATEGATAGGGLGELAGDGWFGASVTSIGSGLWNDKIVVGAPNDGDGGPYRGALYCLGISDDGTFHRYDKISDTQSSFGGVLHDNDYFGSAITWLGDLNGDGYNDIVVGAKGDDDGSGDAGAAWVVLIYDSGDAIVDVAGQQKISQTEGNFTRLLEDAVNFGASAAEIGDLNGDGVVEIAVGAPRDAGGGSDRGAVWILSVGDAGEILASQKIGDKSGGFGATLNDLDQFGLSVAALGDLDLDGVEDIAVGAPMDGTGGPGRGAVYVLFLRRDGTVKSYHKIADHMGGFENTLPDGAKFGYSVSYLGDLRNDGQYELAVGSIGDSDAGPNRGAVWVVSMATNGDVSSEQKINDVEGGFPGVLDDNDFFGTSLASIGDLDDDGVPDLAVGAIGDDDGGADVGAVWLVNLFPNRTVKRIAKVSANTHFAGLLDPGDAFGYSIAPIGDMDGDGYPELAIGAIGDDDGALDAGAVWIAFLDGSGAVKTHGKISNMQGNFGGVLAPTNAFGSAVSPLGDLNADFIPDIVVGQLGEDDGGDEVGAAWPLILSSPDDDHDGVYFANDACPDQDASFFDRDGDGCPDQYIGARHIEYWGVGDTLRYYIQLDGAPNINDGSDFTAIQAAVMKWSIGGVDVASDYGGTVDWDVAVPGDGKNLVTFVDNEYDFGASTLAVGVTTSYDVPTFADGRFYRPGEIVDADMIFNPLKVFKTSGAGPGTDLESVATHEAGHMYGISHSAAVSSIMFYALQGGTVGRQPTNEDSTIIQKAYPNPAWVTTTRRLFGSVRDRFAQPVPGAIVFVTDVTSGETLGCDMTLPDGSFKFILGPPWTSVYLSIHAIDGTSPIGYLEPEYVNALVDTTAVTLFPAERWNTGDSYDEDASLSTPIGLGGAGEYGPFDFIINQDTTGPTVVSHSPGDLAVNVRADAAVVIEFSEAIDANTLQGNFRLFNVLSGKGTGGKALVTADGTVLAFTATKLLEYSTAYICSLKTGIEDLYHNPMPAVYAFQFTTEAEPPLSLTSLVPNKGVEGSIIVFNGAGFDTIPSGDGVSFTDASGLGTVTAPVLMASKTQLIVPVPAGAGSGNVKVEVGPFTSNPVSFTKLESTGVPRGYEVDTAPLGSVPRSIALTPDGDLAYVATAGGAIAIDADPDSPTFLTQTPIPVPAGLNDLAISPDGKWVYAVSETDSMIHVIDRLTNSGVDELRVFAKPRGVVISPSGNRIYVPTNASEIQVWDVNEASATYRKPVGAMTSPGSSFTGKMAIDPAGDYLLALTTAGKLLEFDLGPDTLATSLSLGFDPRDVVVDPAGQRAYVSDGSGSVSIVSMSGFFKVLDVATSGSLRGMAMTPSGEYLYGANRELNFLDVIDLIETSSTYRSVATTIPVGTNPVDVAVSPDGRYAYTLVEDSKTLVVTGIGSGPFIKSLSRRAGPPGTKVVVAGGGFGTNPASLVVKFTDANGSGFFYAPTRTTGRAVAFSVPTGTDQGMASFTITRVGPPDETSNTVSFEVLGLLETEQLGLVSQAELAPGAGLAPAAAMSPLGDHFLVGTQDGRVIFVDTKANSPTFNQAIKSPSVSTSPVYDIALTPDGSRAYVSVPDDQAIRILDTDRSSPTYGTVIGNVSFGAFPVDTPQELAISPDGELLLAQDIASNLLYYVPIRPGGASENQVAETLGINSATQIVFSGQGTHAYMTMGSDEALTTVCVDSSDGDFWTITSTVDLSTVVPGHTVTPLSLSMSPTGSRCLVLAEDDLSKEMRVLSFDTSNPDTTVFMRADTFGDVPPPPAPALAGQRIDVSPGRDRLVYHQTGVGMVSASFSDLGLGNRGMTATPFTLLSQMDQGFAVDGSYLYAIGTYGDSLQVYAWRSALASDTLDVMSGDGQTGVAGLALAAPLRVQVRDYAGPKSGVPVAFDVASGGGVFVGTNTSRQIVSTNGNGYAEVSWKLGAAVGGQSVTATALAEESPRTFTATAVADPNTLPLELVTAKPSNGAANVPATTTVVATFSRPVATSSVTTSSVYLHKTGETASVAGTFGFADNNRVVSITPSSALDFGTSYALEITSAVQDQSAGALANPATIAFATAAAPPLKLVSVSPPSGTVGITVVLAGVSFNPTASQNQVFFGTTKAVPIAAAFDYVKVKVPSGAQTGLVRVYNGADTSNGMPFTVLVQSNVASDAVVATAGTGSATKSVAVDPDGSMAYAVSPEGNVVIPIDVDTKTSLPGISVGDHPISIVAHPEGTYVYVPNFNSATVSIIGIDPTVPAEYHKVVKTLPVGNFPVDVAVHPDGNWVYVVNAGSDYSKNVDIIDSDAQSANQNTVVAKAGTGAVSKCVAVDPDGSRLFVGTDDGYVVLNSGDLSYSVVARGGQGSTAKSVAIDPDGTILFLLTTDGNVLVYDVSPNSSTPNALVATIQGSSSTKEIALSPDGATLYLIQEENDLIDVVGIEIQGAIGVIERGGVLPPFRVVTKVLGSIFAGEDPEAMVFDPRGTGLALVTNSGPKTVTFLEAGFVTLEIPPGTIVIPAYSTVPSIDLVGFEMKNTTAGSLSYKYTISTTGPCQLFPGTLATTSGGPSGAVGALLEGFPGASQSDPYTQVVGTTPVIAPGDSFAPPAAVVHIPAVREHLEQVITYSVSPATVPNLARKRTVRLIVEAPVPVFVHGFSAEALDEGVRLSWALVSDEQVSGFRVYRRESGATKAETANAGELIPIDRREWIDKDARGGREYEYTLGVVLTEGGEALSQPVTVRTKALVLALHQNHPNPFNPTTTIEFTIPEKQQVVLAVYNVAGQRVVTLVDEVMTEGHKRVTWDARNSDGTPVSTGVYFYRLQTGGKTLTKKMVVLK